VLALAADRDARRLTERRRPEPEERCHRGAGAFSLAAIASAKNRPKRVAEEERAGRGVPM
jgi:hypothetical protein